MTGQNNDMAIQQGALRELALFAGAGGGILGGRLLGWRTVCAVERDAYCAAVLAQRQNDGCFEPFPIWSDVETFDGRPWRGIVDVVSGGFPCQDISVAGKGAGINGKRSGLWSQFARIIGEVRPRFAFVENSPNLTSRGLGRVLGDLAEMGYDAEWGVLGAADIGAPHIRKRIWVLAHSHSNGCREGGEAGDFLGADGGQICAVRRVFGSPSKHPGNPSNTNGKRPQERQIFRPSQGEAGRSLQGQTFERKDWWPAEPRLGRVANGVAHRVDRIKALGNGQVPRVAATAFIELKNRLEQQ